MQAILDFLTAIDDPDNKPTSGQKLLLAIQFYDRAHHEGMVEGTRLTAAAHEAVQAAYKHGTLEPRHDSR
jgi:hypothetical protein